MTDTPNKELNQLQNFKGHILGAITALIGSAALGYWAETWAPVVACAYAAFAMGTLMVLLVMVMNFIDLKSAN